MLQFDELDPLLHSQLRLAIISILSSLDSAEFTYLKEQTEASSGNLSVQIDKLEKAKYISVKKSFKGKRPVTTCKITAKGQKAFANYVTALQGYLKGPRKG